MPGQELDKKTRAFSPNTNANRGLHGHEYSSTVPGSKRALFLLLFEEPLKMIPPESFQNDKA